MKSWMWTYVSVCGCALAAPVGAQELTFEGALERARTRTAAVAAARFRVEEARARVRDAGAFRENPVLDAAAGRRERGDADYAVGLTQPLDFGRGARTTTAEAALLRETAASDDDQRLALRAVALAFLRALAEEERLHLARGATAQAEEVLRVAERRRAAGDVADLDVSLARGALARARADAFATEARGALATGELRALLAYDEAEPLALAGTLPPGEAEGIDALLDSAGARPDVRAAQAAVEEAAAEAAAAGALGRPSLAPSVRYERDEGTNVLWGGLSIGLPLWNRGGALREAATARASRLRVQAEAARRTARQEVASAHRAYELRLAAARELALTAELAGDSEALARRSYEEGQIGLAELLLARRETQEVRQAHVDHRLELAAAAVEMRAVSGRLR
jgi:cobalt-zinc-cadmium efflux system outer membrane protein